MMPALQTFPIIQLQVFRSFFLFFAMLFPSWGWASECIKVDKDSFKVTFTGYKYTKKEGVSGTFKDVTVGVLERGLLKEVLKSASVFINTSSIDAGKVARNMNILNSLFKTLSAGHSIRALVDGVNMDKQLMRVRLFMGDTAQVLQLKFEETADSLRATGRIDLLELGFNAAFEALAKQCAALHAGKDGVSKTWSDVDLEFTISKTSC